VKPFRNKHLHRAQKARMKNENLPRAESFEDADAEMQGMYLETLVFLFLSFLQFYIFYTTTYKTKAVLRIP